tara:strand:+ start:8665 stop:9663 length:999 start_codon:yes stop_codon:yes gene_type:complete
MGVLRQIYVKLFTREDTFNFHKTLGLACLLSYVVRFAQVGPRDMAFGADGGTALTIAMHTLLSVSSLIFKIPFKRIAGGYRIWPEYRLHSIIFACRSLAGMALTWYELRHGAEANYWANMAIVVGTLAAADLASWSVGEGGRSSTIRDLEAGPATHFFFSAMQFYATMGCMLGIRRFSVQFLYVFIIQFNAFLMTIRRKNLLPHGVLVTTYGAMLAFGFVVASYEHHRLGMVCMINALSNVAAVARIGFGVPKYALWLGMGLATQYARASVVDGAPFAAHWPALYAGSTLALLAVGYRKVSKKQQQAKAAGTPADMPMVEPTPESVAKVKAN